MQIHDTTFVVVDTETTGTKAPTNRVIEIAAVKVRGGEVVGRFDQLIDPGCAVPRRITELTGISTAMVYGQPPMRQVMPRFLDFLGDAVFVAHNAPFDQRFLDAELARLGRAPLDNPVLCTLRLARRLLPGLRSKGLTGVSDHYGIRIAARHRALGDAEATAEVLTRFVSQLAYEHDVDTLDALLAFQNQRYSKAGAEPRHLGRIRKEVLPTLPDRPGVYFMKDGKGGIIYIGKAKSLRDRVRSYFTAIEAHAAKTRKLVHAVRDVTWEETGSELAALLLESRLIKQHQPRFNRALRRYRNKPFIRLDVEDDFPTVSWNAYILDDGAEYYGPLRGRKQAELVVELVNRFFRLRECDDDTFARGRRCLYASFGRCDGPCADADAAAAYDAEVQRVRDFLMGRDRGILDRLDQAMREASAEMRYEEAREYRDWMQQLGRLLDKQQFLAAPVYDQNAVVVQPHADGGAAHLFLIRFGRHVETVHLPADADAAAVADLRERLAAQFDAAQPRPERYFKQEIDEVRVLAHWLYVHREEVRQVPWQAGTPTDDLLAAVLAEVGRLRSAA